MRHLKKGILLLLCILGSSSMFAQVGVGTNAPDSSAVLDVYSKTSGFLPPRMTEVEMNAIENPADGLVVYCTDCYNGEGCLILYKGGTGTCITSSGGSCDELYGNPNLDAQANSTSTTVELCDGATLTLSSTDDGSWASGGATYSWTGPNGYTSTSAIPGDVTTNFVAATHAGTYVVTIKNGQASGCSKTDSVVVEGFSPIGSGIPAISVNGGYTDIVKGSTGLTVDADLTNIPNAANLNWTITPTGGTGVTFTSSGTTTLTTASSTASVTIDVDALATAASFTVSFKGEDACGTEGTASNSVNLNIQAPLSVAENSLTAAPHRENSGNINVATLPSISGSSSGSWTLATAPTITTSGVTPTYTASSSNNITSPSPATVQTITINSPTSPTAATIQEDVDVVDYISPDTYTITATWVENYPATTYESVAGNLQVAVTFIGCQNDISVGTGAIVQMMYDYDGNGTAEYSWCAREITPAIELAAHGSNSHLSGKTWLDRNLGAYQVAAAYNDAAGYGDLYQWGRSMDGHQKRYQRSSDPAENSGTQGQMANGTTSTNSNNPGNNLFITESNSPYDWRTTQSSSLWTSSGGTNNPCPDGYYVPTESQLQTLESWLDNETNRRDRAMEDTELNLPVAGSRLHDNGAVNNIGSTGNYWSSSVPSINASALRFSSSSSTIDGNRRARGFSVRCLRD